ncbi:MAG: DNA repair protein RecO [Candidatus Nealsonbacteria bacterium]|nr:MAG: DNA repair protein RecO [Candidatus Nealsonbacteria bacterium]
MFVHYRTKGIILKKVDRKEADQLFTLYTKDFGKLKILGKAIRKISSKLRSGMEIFYLSEIEFIQGKAYKTLTDAIVIEKFENLRKDLGKLTVAVKISEALDNLILGQEPDKRIWNLLLRVFKELDRVDFKIKNLELIYYYFFWKLLSILGYQPELYQCSICQKKLKPEKLYFSKKEGGIICQNCFLKEKSGREITPDAVKILRIILDKNNQIIFRLKVKREQLRLLENISKEYFREEN